MITYEEFESMKNEKGYITDFFDIVKKDLCIENNPKADKMMRIAWEMGHSNGYNEVYTYACDLVELIQ
jgi:hypothetical protein